MKKVSKAIGALLGGVTAGIVIAVAGAAGKNIDPGVATVIAVLCSTVGAWLAPRNQPS